MIEYIIDKIPSNDIFIIYNIFLDEYNFQEILINKCKYKKLYFSQIDYQTRGTAETAFVGINKFVKLIDSDSSDSNIVFLDNIDNIQVFDLTIIFLLLKYLIKSSFSIILILCRILFLFL
jgi:hypothetical protein